MKTVKKLCSLPILPIIELVKIIIGLFKKETK